MFRALITDFDGVINDSVRLGGKRIIGIVRNAGYPIPDNIHERFTGVWDPKANAFRDMNWGLRGAVLVQKAFDVPQEVAERLYAEWERIDAIDYFPLIPGAVRVLRKLRSRGMKLLMLTNRNRKNLIKVMKHYDLVRYFDHIQTYDDWSFCKPDPHSFCRLLDILQKEGIGIEETLYIGDAPADFEAAHGRGVPNVSVLSGIFRQKHFLSLGQQRGNILYSVADLPAWLRKHPAS